MSIRLPEIAPPRSCTVNVPDRPLIVKRLPNAYVFGAAIVPHAARAPLTVIPSDFPQHAAHEQYPVAVTVRALPVAAGAGGVGSLVVGVGAGAGVGFGEGLGFATGVGFRGDVVTSSEAEVVSTEGVAATDSGRGGET